MAGDIIFFSLAGPMEILYIILQAEVGGGGGIVFFGWRIACKFGPEEKPFVSGNFAAQKGAR